MATVTSPILTDATFATKMDALAAAVKPDASDIPLTPPSGMTATNVQDGFSEIKQSFVNLLASTEVKGTTSSSGALAIPVSLQDTAILDPHYIDGNVGLIFRRDRGYFTCCDNNRNTLANTAVVVKVFYINN